MKKIFQSLLSLNPTSLTLGIILLTFVIFLLDIPVLYQFELETYDLRFSWRGKIETSKKVVAAVIDEKSLQQEGKWPWPRHKIAKLIDKLSDGGAKVIGFDVFFLEPDENSTLLLLNKIDEQVKNLNIQDNTLTDLIRKNKAVVDNDQQLVDAIKRSKSKIVLGYFFQSKEGMAGEITQDEINQKFQLINNANYTVFGEIKEVAKDFYTSEFEPYFPELNIEAMHHAANSSGYINMLSSTDGVVRAMPLAMKCGKDYFSPLSVQCVWHYFDNPNLMLVGNQDGYGIQGIRLGEELIPTDEHGKLLVNFAGPPPAYPLYSITDILNDKLPPDTFKDKIIIIGATAVGAHDLRNTPVSSAHPGMEVHMAIIDNILSNNLISQKQGITFDVLAIILIGILTGLAVPRLRVLKGTFFVAGLFIFYVFLCRWVFTNHNLWINMIYPLLTLILVYTSSIIYHYLVEEKNKRFLHSTFSSYLSPELIEDMVASETTPELGGEARNITAYFTDIQGFSTFSEKLTAPQLVELLNEYLSAMTDILIAEDGTLDKYEGDAIIAFFGAPLEIPDNPFKACKVAIAMQNSLLELRKKWKEEKQLPDEPERNIKNLPSEEWTPGAKWPNIVHQMKMRIGVNSGEIVVGNMGSSMRMNYTMMGDSVNLAARLEEGAKQFGIYSSVSEYTMDMEYLDENGQRKKAWNFVEARFIDRITVVGKSEPVKIYELCALKGELSDQEKKLFQIFDRGMQHYLKMHWDEAIKHFKSSLKLERVPDGITTPSEVYIKRCEAFKEDPPVAKGEKWDGVFRMTKK
jgi:adenylate cyclase